MFIIGWLDSLTDLSGRQADAAMQQVCCGELIWNCQNYPACQDWPKENEEQ
jgi:hypothetical protein